MTLCPMCGAPIAKPPEISESGRHERIPAPILPPVAPEPRPAAAVSDFGFDDLIVEPEPPAPAPTRAVTPNPPSPPHRVKLDDDDSWYCSLPAIVPPPETATPAIRKHFPIKSVFREATRRVVAGAAKVLPTPEEPLTAPLVLGIFALVAGLILPLAAAFESNRIFGILGFCVCGLFLPIAPVAWIAGLAAEKRRREQGLRAERQVVVGRLLGQWGTMILAAEGMIALILVAALRLGGKLPATFWAP